MRTRWGIATLFGLAATSAAQVTTRISVTNSGAQVVGASDGAAISRDGRFAAFRSLASTLVAGDTYGGTDVFVRDLASGTNELVDVSTGGVQGTGDCEGVVLSSDGRFVAFESRATNLTADAPIGFVFRVFVRDRTTGTTVLASLSSAGTFPANHSSHVGGISDDGRYVAFTTTASLVPGDVNTPYKDVYVRDLVAQTTEWISFGINGSDGPSEAYGAVMTPDGRFVAWTDQSNDIVPGDTNPERDVFVRDRLLGVTALASLGPGGVHATISCESPRISADGRFILFTSATPNFASGDNEGRPDVFLRDRLLGTTELVDGTASGAFPNGFSFGAGLSDDARYVVFASAGTNLIAGDTNGTWDLFRRDRLLHTLVRISTSSYLVQANADCLSSSTSADGRTIVFGSTATTLVPGDSNGASDVFLHRPRSEAGVAFCFGDGSANGGPDCPCGNNAPEVAERGCVHAFGRGALLRAVGTASISEDTLSLVVVDLPPISPCVFLQAQTAAGGGLGEPVWFDGLRCLDAGLVRMRSRAASGGTCQLGYTSEFVSFLGGVTTPGPRLYQAVYRNYGGPCELLANTTNAVEVTWTP